MDVKGKRLIDANALSALLDVEYKRKMKLVRKGENQLNTLAEGIMSMSVLLGTMPTVDAVKVVHGEWISDEGDVLFHCSECETQISTSWNYDDLHWNYCPNCGAKMDNGG